MLKSWENKLSQAWKILQTTQIPKILTNKLCIPSQKEIFKVYDLPLEQIKVVIIGEEPNSLYSNGLAFSTTNKNEILKPVFTSMLKSELSPVLRTNFNLEDWASQGVFLLNLRLSTEQYKPLVHANQGWEEFTGETLSLIAKISQPVVFIVWGNAAKQAVYQYVTPYIDTKTKLILEDCHPLEEVYGKSKFSTNNHLKLANDFLEKHNQTPIIWHG